MKGTKQLILIFAMVAAVSVLADGGFSFTNLDFYTEDAQTHVILEADSTFFYTSYKMNDTALVVEIPDGKAGALPSEKSLGTSEVDAIDIEQVSESRLKMTFTMKPGVTYDIWMHGKNLYIDFAGSGTPSDTWETVPAVVKEEPVVPASVTVEEPVTAEETETVETPVYTPAEESAPAVVSESVLPSASYLIGVRQGANDSISIDADGAMDYYDFVLEEPLRIVIDINDVVNSLGSKAIDNLGNPFVERVRVAQYRSDPKVARVVIDMKKDAPYRIETRNESLVVNFGGAEAPAAEEPVITKAEAVTPPPVVEAPQAETAAPVAARAVAVEKELTAEDFRDLGLASIEDKEDVTLFEAVEPESVTSSTTKVTAKSFEANLVAGDQVQYTGEPISVDFKDADLKEVFRFFSDISGLNFVLDKTVGGKITIGLREVPWDQALDIVLKNESLGKTFENNVLRIAPVAKLSQEEAAQRKLKEEQELSVPPITITKAISYAKAKDIEKMLKSVLSKRGMVQIDERTNTMIIMDIPENRDAIVSLIDILDTPNPQVEIEARIVETSKSYARNLGVQWGANTIVDQAHGNTTSLDFPNSVKNTELNETTTSNLYRNFLVAPPIESAYGGIGFLFGNVLDTFTLDVNLMAMERDSKGKILSAPKITTQNNVRAKIESGTQIPIVTTTSTDISVEFKSASLTLEVTPQITADNTIIMMLKVDKSQPDFGNAVQGVPSITTRNAETTVLVENGGTAVIGGIFQVTEGSGEDRIPFFGKIPGLGWLFRSKTKSISNDELLIFITPRILTR